MASQVSPPRLRLRVTNAAEAAVRGGHPWVFAESIRAQNREGQLGELAVIFDRKDRFLAVGLFDPESPLRVRVLHSGRPAELNAEWWQRRFRSAVSRRLPLFDLRTNGCRWINGENDGWPGLVLDRYVDTLVLKLYTAAWLPRLEEVMTLIVRELQPHRLVLRLSRNIQALVQRQFRHADGDILLGPPVSEPIVFLETGLRFQADVLQGQKTGFFLDQRENRRIVESLSGGRAVLNAFSFTGGFSLYAARGGAAGVTDLDISAHALAGAKANFRLNLSTPSIVACRHETVQTDAFAWLEENRARKFDLVILDPPSLARRESERSGAIHAYGKLAAAGIASLQRGGVLMAASCSAHVNSGEFFEAVRQSAIKSRRSFQELRTTGHAEDHPAIFPEARYLKSIYLRFQA